MRIPLNKKGVAIIEKMCRDRVTGVLQLVATEAADYLLNFGYHAFLNSGPNGGEGPGWSWYYAANWNVAIGSPDNSVITPERDPFAEDEKAYEVDLYEKLDELKEKPFKDAKIDDVLYVTNSVYYGKWLNDGGTEFLTHLNEAKPNRFIELCEAYLKDKMNDFIKEIKEASK